MALLIVLYLFKPLSVTLKQSQGHQSQNDNVDPKQGSNDAKFKRSCSNGVQENVKVFFK